MLWDMLRSMGKIEMLEQDMSGLDERDYSDEFLDSAKGWIQKWGWGFTVLMVLVWPVLSFPAGVFSKDYFAFWIFISITWSFVATFVIIWLPIYESMDSLRGVCLYLIGRKAATLPEQSEAKADQGAKEESKKDENAAENAKSVEDI